MKFLHKMKTDSKIIMRNLQETNETLLNTLIEYQDIIFGQKETIMNLNELVESLKQEIESLKTDGDKCDR